MLLCLGRLAPHAAWNASQDGWTLLHRASDRGDSEAVLALIAAGADVNATDVSGGAVMAGRGICYPARWKGKLGEGGGVSRRG